MSLYCMSWLLTKAVEQTHYSLVNGLNVTRWDSISHLEGMWVTYGHRKAFLTSSGKKKKKKKKKGRNVQSTLFIKYIPVPGNYIS